MRDLCCALTLRRFLLLAYWQRRIANFCSVVAAASFCVFSTMNAFAAVVLIGSPSSQFAASDTLPGFNAAAGTNRLLVVVASDSTASSVDSVTFGSTPMVRIAQLADTVAVDSIWTLKLGSSVSPSSGSIAISTNGTSTARQRFIAAAVFANVDQNVPTSGAATNQAAGDSTLAISSAAGDLSFDVFDAFRLASAPVLVSGSSQTVLHSGGGALASGGFGEYRTSTKPGASSSMSWTSNADVFTHIGVNIRSTSAAPYCTPLNTSNCSNGAQLSRFSLKGEANPVDNLFAGACAANSVPYRDNTSAFAPVTIARSDTYSGFLRTQTANGYVTVWIDFNDNGVFEDSERLLDNLPINTTDKLYGVHISSAANLGVHRMRVRNVDSASAPTETTSPCASYALGDAADYLVEIVATGAPRSVAPGVPGSCSAAAEMTIGPSSNNSGAGLVNLIDANNNYVAALAPNGNNFGNIKPSFYVHNGPVRQDPGGRYYMDRNITIASQLQPANTYIARLHYRNSELNALIAQPGSGVTSQFDLIATKSDFNVCTTSLRGATSSAVFPTGFGSLSGDRFVDFTGLTTLSSFFLHGGSTQLEGPTTPFAIISHPANLSVAAGQPAYFVATAAGTSSSTPPTIQWFESADGGGTFTPISGAISTRLSFTASVADHNKQYRAVFTLDGEITTTAATLSITNGGVLNVDNSDTATTYAAATDGVLLMRYLLGLRGASLIADARGTGPSLRDAAQIEAHLANNLSLFDVDGDRQVSATSDGLMILRRLLNPGVAPSDAAAAAAITANAKRTTRSNELVVRAIDALKP